MYGNMIIGPHNFGDVREISNDQFHRQSRKMPLASFDSSWIAIDPNQSAFHNILGLALWRLGKPDLAVTSLGRAISLDAISAQAHHNLGVVQKEQGQLDHAIASFRRAVAIDPDYTPAHCDLGDALQSAGRLSDSVLSYGCAVALDGRMMRTTRSHRASIPAIVCAIPVPEMRIEIVQ